jgi:hypothetical protein
LLDWDIERGNLIMLKKTLLNMMILFLISATLLEGCETMKPINFHEKTVASSNNNIKTKLAKYIDNYSKKNEFSGTILITKDDEVLLNKGYGTLIIISAFKISRRLYFKLLH